MYAAAGGASIASRKARQHGRQPLPPSPTHSAAVRAYSCQHWEARLLVPPPAPPPPRPLSSLSEPSSPCDVIEMIADVVIPTHKPLDPYQNACAAGRAAWQEAAALSVGGGGAAGGAARRCSVVGDHPTARRDPKAKWIRNNRVRDASYGSSSDSEGDYGNGDTWGVARLLYAGLGTLALGLVVYFVGTGDKGFKTPALRLVGPSLIIAGLACCLLRIALCIFAKPCCRRRTNKENRRFAQISSSRLGAEGEELPLARGPRTGPAQCSPARRLDTSSCDVSSLSSGEEDERLRRYRRAEPSNLPRRTAFSAPALQGTTVEQIVVQPKPEQTVQVEPAPAPSRRPPPRNVSFAGPAADGEIVLSVAQLRS